MTKIIHLRTPQRNCTSASINPVTKQNVVAISTAQRVPVPKAYLAESGLLDRIRVWIDEGGGGGDIQ